MPPRGPGTRDIVFVNLAGDRKGCDGDPEVEASARALAVAPGCPARSRPRSGGRVQPLRPGPASHIPMPFTQSTPVTLSPPSVMKDSNTVYRTWGHRGGAAVRRPWPDPPVSAPGRLFWSLKTPGRKITTGSTDQWERGQDEPAGGIREAGHSGRNWTVRNKPCWRGGHRASPLRSSLDFISQGRSRAWSSATAPLCGPPVWGPTPGAPPLASLPVDI